MSTGVTLQKNFRVGSFPSKGSFSGKGIPSGMIQAYTFESKPGTELDRGELTIGILVNAQTPDANGFLNLALGVNTDFGEVQNNNLHIKVPRTIYIFCTSDLAGFDCVISGYDIAKRPMVCSGNQGDDSFVPVRAFADLQSIKITGYEGNPQFIVMVSNEFAMPFNSNGNLTYFYQVSNSDSLGLSTAEGDLPLAGLLTGNLKPGIANKPFGDTGLPEAQTANTGLSTDQFEFTGYYELPLVFTFGFNAEGYGCPLVYPKFMDPPTMETLPTNSLATTLGVEPYNIGWTAWQ